MAQTIETLINAAARQLGELQANQTLDSDTIDTVLFPIARDWFNGLPGIVTGTDEYLFPLSVAGATTLGAGNVSLKCTTSCTVTLPADPKDGWRIIAAYVASGQTLTIAPNGNKIDGGTSNATVAAAATDEWFFREDIRDWVSPLITAKTDNAPYPDSLLDGLKSMLAIEIQPVLGLPIKPDTRRAAAAAEKTMVFRYFRKNPALYTRWRYRDIPEVAA